jgi:hypothetical protein
MLFSVKAKVALNTAVTDGTGGDHLGVTQGMLRQQSVKEPAMAIGPVDHGGSTDSPRGKIH